MVDSWPAAAAKMLQSRSKPCDQSVHLANGPEDAALHHHDSILHTGHRVVYHHFGALDLNLCPSGGVSQQLVDFGELLFTDIHDFYAAGANLLYVPFRSFHSAARDADDVLHLRPHRHQLVPKVSRDNKHSKQGDSLHDQRDR